MVGGTVGMLLFWAGWAVWYGGSLAFQAGRSSVTRIAGLCLSIVGGVGVWYTAPILWRLIR
jgi:hypothetical protein